VLKPFLPSKIVGYHRKYSKASEGK